MKSKLLLLLLVVTAGGILVFSALPKGTSAKGTQAPPSWIDGWRDATVAIGHVSTLSHQDGSRLTTKKIFAANGTGVLLALPEDPNKTPWLVTARHVLEDPSTGTSPDSIQIRFAWFGDRPFDEYLGITIPMTRNGKPVWYPHPDPTVDLACLPLVLQIEDAGRASAPGVMFDSFASADEIFDGAPILTLGFAGALGPTYWTRPVVKGGVISWSAPFDPERNKFLIDANITKGFSGGPVFRVPSGIGRDGGLVVGGRAAFLGIATQTVTQSFPISAGGAPMMFGQTPVSGASLFGVGVVEPAARVKELLAHAAASRHR